MRVRVAQAVDFPAIEGAIVVRSTKGHPAKAVAQLQALLRSVPQSAEVLLALTDYNTELGQRKKALGYAKILTQIAPGNRTYQKLYQDLSKDNP